MGDKKKLVRRKKVKELLKCDLTDKEMLAFAEKMADAQADAQVLQFQLDSTKKEYQGKIDAKSAESERIGGIILAKYEYRDVDCELVEDFTAKRVKLVRLDTGKTEKDRDMTAQELEQLPLDAEEATE